MSVAIRGRERERDTDRQTFKIWERGEDSGSNLLKKMGKGKCRGICLGQQLG